MVANKKIINSKDISIIFGLNSNIFKDFHQFLYQQKVEQTSIFKKRFSAWKAKFYNIYGKDIEEELFIKHSYYISLLRIILTIKLTKNIDPIDKRKNKFNINDVFYPEEKLFFCPKIPDQLLSTVLKLLNDTHFALEDLFQSIYQQIFFTITRHKIGEFYTPKQLVKTMLIATYQVGLKTLDPSCGSGSFLIEIILTISDSNYPISSKLKAIENLFGFDVNPLATLTAKVNVILLLLELFGENGQYLPKINIFNINTLFPDNDKNELSRILKDLYNSFDLIIGNPPWLTYKDLINKEYQVKIRSLADELEIKPLSQYITHIELGAIFFYASAKNFLKVNGVIFFVITKSVLNGDHCFKFRNFKLFKEIEIWDFPEYNFFNIQHICLKAKYVGESSPLSIKDKYPIKTYILNNEFAVIDTQNYSSLKIENDGARIILPEKDLAIINNLTNSPYKAKFLQGATLVPKTLIFFIMEQNLKDYLLIRSDPEILKRAKNKWKFEIKNQKIELKFAFKTFLNKDMVPFYIKQFRHIFLPVNNKLEFDPVLLKENPLAFKYYNKINAFYKENKKETSRIETLFSNLNYWNKLTKQNNQKTYNVVYNASGSSLKAAVIDNSQERIIISSENYYFSTNSLNGAFYLSSLLNTPLLSKYIKLIKSSRHIHKRPFLFPIPLYNKEDDLHQTIAKKGIKYQTVVQDLVANNKNISSEKVRMFIHQKLSKLNNLASEVIFNSK